MRRFALVAFSLCLLAASPLLAADDAQEKDDICAPLDNATEENKKHFKLLLRGLSREEACRRVYWRWFRAGPADKLLNTESFKTYREALERRDCDIPLALVANAFVALFPKAPNILNSDDHFEAWKDGVLDNYLPELRLCLILRDISEAQAEIERRAIAAKRFLWSDEDQSTVPVVQKRNDAMYSLVWNHYTPALVALLRLSHEGKVVRFVPEFQYFLLQVLLLRGVERHQVANMVAAAEAKLRRSQIEDLKRQAQAGKYTGLEPRTE